MIVVASTLIGAVVAGLSVIAADSGVGLVQILVLLVALGGLIVSVLTVLHTRKKDDTEQKVAGRVNEFDELATMNEVLRAGLHDAQTRSDALREDLAAAQRDVDDLNVGLTVALANITLLNDYIEDHVPKDVPRPRLRKMPT